MKELDSYTYTWAGRVDIQHVSATVVIHGVPADSLLGVPELLLHPVHHGLAVQALEGAMYQFWVNRIGLFHLTRDLGQGSDLDGGQVSQLRK